MWKGGAFLSRGIEEILNVYYSLRHVGEAHKGA
jgi:hypothetical protein